MILPFWPSQFWFAEAMKMLVTNPLLLPFRNILTQPRKAKVEPMKVQLLACCLSGIPYKPREFQKTQQVSSNSHGGVPLLHNTTLFSFQVSPEDASHSSTFRNLTVLSRLYAVEAVSGCWQKMSLPQRLNSAASNTGSNSVTQYVSGL